MRDGRLRRAVKSIARVHYELNLGLYRALLRRRRALPWFLEGCGYRAVAGNASGLIRALERAALDGEQRARLEKDLNLR